MKVCFIGVGSIAKRHIRNLKALLNSNIEIEVLRSGKGYPLDSDVTDKLSKIHYSVDTLDKHYDAMFITNPTNLHYETILQFKSRSENFFIEKPVFVTGSEDISPFLNDGKTYYVACPLRYTNVIQWLKANIDFSSVYSMRSISSSYLPEWRPGTDYRKNYSAHKAQGGGVAIDLIHEWDYICHLTGYPIEVKSFLRRKSHLELDSEDVAIYIADYENKTVEIHLDYFGRATVRTLELYCLDDTIIVDFLKQRINWLKADRVLEMPQERDDYMKLELKHFLDIMSKKIPCDNDIPEAMRVLRIAGGL